jgi:DNA mismatch repair protein MutS
MHLDTVAIKNLELLNSMKTGKTENSLLSVIDSTGNTNGCKNYTPMACKAALRCSKN